MIFFFNLVISAICLVPIAIYLIKPKMISKNHFRNHFIIFISKLSFISMFIYIFIYNFSIYNYKLFIVTGCFNFIVFHFIEGFVSQKKLVHNDIKK